MSDQISGEDVIRLRRAFLADITQRVEDRRKAYPQLTDADVTAVVSELATLKRYRPKRGVGKIAP